MTLTKELCQLLQLIPFNSNLTEMATSKGAAYKLYNYGNYACFLGAYPGRRKIAFLRLWFYTWWS